MLFVKDGKDHTEPSAVYLVSEDMESLIRAKVELCLRDHGYTIGQRDEVLKDLSFLRCKRQLIEHLCRQLWLFILRSIIIGCGVLIMIGLQEYVK